MMRQKRWREKGSIVPYLRSSWQTCAAFVTKWTKLPTLWVNTCLTLWFFCESWLSCGTPDDAIQINGYTSIRNDRDSRGGVIIAYFINNLRVNVINDISTILPPTETEFSVFVLPEVSLLLIAMYHPVWNNPEKHGAALDCIMVIIDFVLSYHLDSCKARIILCGDFNDLRLYNNKIKKLTGLKQIVKFPTRGKNTLDQIFTNIPTIKPVRIFPLIGKSDHSCVFWSHQDHVVHYVKRSVRLMSKSRIARFNSILTIYRCYSGKDMTSMPFFSEKSWFPCQIQDFGHCT